MESKKVIFREDL